MAASTIGWGVSLALSQKRSVASVSVGGASGASAASPSPSPVASSSSSDPQALNRRAPAIPTVASCRIFTSSSTTLGGGPPGPSHMGRPAGAGGSPEPWSCDAQLSIEHEPRSAEEDVVLPERAEPDVDVVADRRHGAFTDGGESCGPERLVEHVERARQHDLPQIERAHHRGEGLAQAAAAVGVVAPAQAGGSRRRLQAADAPAGTHLSVGIDGDMTNLAGGETVAEHEVAVEDQPGAYAPADLDGQQAPLGRTVESQLAEGGRVGVVGHVGGSIHC